MKLALLNEGSDNFKISHTKKDTSEKKGRNIELVYCGQHVFNQESAFLERSRLELKWNLWYRIPSLLVRFFRQYKGIEELDNAQITEY